MNNEELLELGADLEPHWMQRSGARYTSQPSEASWRAADFVIALLFVVAVGGFFAGVAG
jgi:hypothetical protein